MSKLSKTNLLKALLCTAQYSLVAQVILLHGAMGQTHAAQTKNPAASFILSMARTMAQFMSCGHWLIE